LDRELDLRRFRTAHRGEDAEVDCVLVALAAAAAAWRSSVGGTSDENRSELASESSLMLSTSAAADRRGTTTRAITKAIEEGRLRATKVAGRWQIDPADFAHFDAASAA
jgi:hypothetical protein